MQGECQALPGVSLALAGRRKPATWLSSTGERASCGEPVGGSGGCGNYARPVTAKGRHDLAGWVAVRGRWGVEPCEPVGHRCPGLAHLGFWTLFPITDEGIRIGCPEPLTAVTNGDALVRSSKLGPWDMVRALNMSRKNKPQIPVRPGNPTNCVRCGQPLHGKSEHYCSKACWQECNHEGETETPAFLSKWKIRKRKEMADPLVLLRQKARRKTRDAIKKGLLSRGRCAVCRSLDVIPHHEDYSAPLQVIWLCDTHHKEYHEGKIALFGGTLRWDPARLTEVGTNVNYPKEKYRLLTEIHNENAEGDA